MQVTLSRFAYTPQGTFGRLVAGDYECFTVERPWIDNTPGISCIPEGSYPLVLGPYHRGGYLTYELREVPGRSQIKIHKANIAAEVRGCIAPGWALGVVGGAWAVVESRRAFEGFMAAMENRARAQILIEGYRPRWSGAT